MKRLAALLRTLADRIDPPEERVIVTRHAVFMPEAELPDGYEPPSAALTPPPVRDVPADECRGFRWIGQSFATCDGCGRPAWEHEGMERHREDAPFTMTAADFEVRPWGPGEAEAIKRKWGSTET